MFAFGFGLRWFFFSMVCGSAIQVALDFSLFMNRFWFHSSRRCWKWEFSPHLIALLTVFFFSKYFIAFKKKIPLYFIVVVIIIFIIFFVFVFAVCSFRLSFGHFEKNCDCIVILKFHTLNQISKKLIQFTFQRRWCKVTIVPAFLHSSNEPDYEGNSSKITYTFAYKCPQN